MATVSLISYIPKHSNNFFLYSEDDGTGAKKKQVQAILLFVDLVLQQSVRKRGVSDELCIRECVRLLLDMSNLHETGTTASDLVEISQLAVKALGHLLRIVSVVEFMSAVVILLKSKNPTVRPDFCTT